MSTPPKFKIHDQPDANEALQKFLAHFQGPQESDPHNNLNTNPSPQINEDEDEDDDKDEVLTRIRADILAQIEHNCREVPPFLPTPTNVGLRYNSANVDETLLEFHFSDEVRRTLTYDRAMRTLMQRIIDHEDHDESAPL